MFTECYESGTRADMRREAVVFQTVGASIRKAREPNDKLDRATDKTLAELK